MLNFSNADSNHSENKTGYRSVCVCVRLMMVAFTVMTEMITRVKEHIWRIEVHRVQRWGQIAEGDDAWIKQRKEGEELPSPMYVQKRHDLPWMRGNTASQTGRQTTHILIPRISVFLQCAVNSITEFSAILDSSWLFSSVKGPQSLRWDIFTMRSPALQGTSASYSP